MQMAIDTGVEAFKRQQTAITRPDNRPLLAQIRCPTLVLVGRQDVLTPPALAQEIAAGIAGARLEIIAECGHLSTLERPQAVNQAMRAWLSVALPAARHGAAFAASRSASPSANPVGCGFGRCRGFWRPPPEPDGRPESGPARARLSWFIPPAASAPRHRRACRR